MAPECRTADSYVAPKSTDTCKHEYRSGIEGRGLAGSVGIVENRKKELDG